MNIILKKLILFEWILGVECGVLSITHTFFTETIYSFKLKTYHNLTHCACLWTLDLSSLFQSLINTRVIFFSWPWTTLRRVHFMLMLIEVFPEPQVMLWLELIVWQRTSTVRSRHGRTDIHTSSMSSHYHYILKSNNILWWLKLEKCWVKKNNGLKTKW